MFHNGGMKRGGKRIGFCLLAAACAALPASPAGAGKGIERGYEIRVGHYKLINPLLDCEIFQDGDFDELDPFIHKVQTLIDEKKKQGKLTDAAVYFRDLNNGPWFGVNIRDQFAPVSLLKVPLMIGWLKQAETRPQLLRRKIRYKPSMKDRIPGQTIDPERMLVPGKTYTVEELLRRMIAYSDNHAADLLFSHMDQDWFLQTHRDLGLMVPYTDKPIDYITVKAYSSFFRILFNASYLSRDMSEKALDLLTQSDFKDGLVAGVPAGTLVAHKFGELLLNEGLSQLHDCGIVYYPRHPYVLSVMTRGPDSKELKATIAEISRLIYSQVDAEFGKNAPSPASGTATP